MSVSLPTTWKRDGVVHEVKVIQGFHPTILDKTFISFRTTCGIYEKVDDGRAFVFGRAVGCIHCLNDYAPPLMERSR